MNKRKISLNEIKGALTRSEMRKIMAGSGGGTNNCSSSCEGSCTLECGGGATSPGTCGWTGSKCTCGGAC